MYEVIGAVVAVTLTTAVTNLYMQLDTNKTTGLTNKDAIASSDKVGEAEIKRSTAIDVQGEIERNENKNELKELDDFMHRIDKQVGKLQTAVEYLHGDGKMSHGDSQHE
jgi:hypothetical protein